MSFVSSFFVLSLIAATHGQIAFPPGFVFVPGPIFPATKGFVWPKPQQETKTEQFFVVNPDIIQFRILQHNCDILSKALVRYRGVIKDTTNTKREYLQYAPPFNYYLNPNYLGWLFVVDISLTSPCTGDIYPQADMTEEYTLNITRGYKRILSNSIWGILKGLETLSQLIYLASDLRTLVVNVTSIHDFPRFSYRGLSLDTSRHYIPKDKILKFLDTMSYNKYNVFHWHLTDDNSFPYVSKRFPELSAEGAYHPAMIYDQRFVREVQQYARDRGIRVMAEFDTPGHTLAWGQGKPDLLSPCVPNFVIKFGPIDPTKESNYEFLFDFFDEVGSVFKERYVHLGGDEVDFTCWESNPNITQFMIDNDLEGDYVALQSYYSQRLINYVNSINLKTVVWEDVFTNGAVIPESTIIQVWQRDNPQGVLANATAAGHNVIMSACWYLDQLATGGDWLKYYVCDAQDFPGTIEQKQKVLGGEACMWSEVVNEYNLESRVWPRASAIVEKLWSALPVITSETIVYDIAPRLEEHTCRMNKRGIGAQPPSAPNFCL